MATLSAEVYAKYRRVVRNCADNPERRQQFERVIWKSLPVVYPNWFYDLKVQGNQYAAIRRYRARINSYIDEMCAVFGDAYLVTLTFGDCYDTTTFETRKAYARRWLNKSALDYYACLDVGAKNGRQHYHAICCFDPNAIEAFKVRSKTFYRLKNAPNWSFGYFTIEKIGGNATDTRKARKYVFKASAYAFKARNAENKPFHKRGARTGLFELPLGCPSPF